jgi:hypothetical protein
VVSVRIRYLYKKNTSGLRWRNNDGRCSVFLNVPSQNDKLSQKVGNVTNFHAFPSKWRTFSFLSEVTKWQRWVWPLPNRATFRDPVGRVANLCLPVPTCAYLCQRDIGRLRSVSALPSEQEIFEPERKFRFGVQWKGPRTWTEPNVPVTNRHLERPRRNIISVYPRVSASDNFVPLIGAVRIGFWLQYSGDSDQRFWDDSWFKKAWENHCK